MAAAVTHWTDDAACKGLGPGLFFATDTIGGGKGDQPARREAYKVCAGCPVRIVCLAHALHFPELHGVWGGTSERERVRMRAKLRRGASGAA